MVQRIRETATRSIDIARRIVFAKDVEKSYQARLDHILRSNDGVRDPIALFGAVDDEFWLWCFTEGYRSDDRLRSILPAFPPEEVQYRFTGAAGDNTMKEAFSIYRLVKSLADRYLRGRLDSVLEFGCGWGRIVRLFTRDVEPHRLWGIDCLPAAIDICKQTIPDTHFELVEPFPPTRAPERAFSLVYAYSVFSHLSEAAHLAWLGEFRRILRPGGLLVATTRPRDFILTCAQLRAAGEQRAWAPGYSPSFSKYRRRPGALRSRRVSFRAETGGGTCWMRRYSGRLAFQNNMF